jgi:hypothetical protein
MEKKKSMNKLGELHNLKVFPVAVRSKAWVYSRLTAGVAGSNPAEDTDIRLLCL